jgi:hypothetical protein
MWLEELQLTDFRGFRHLKLDLRRQLTVLIGVNGAGKSSVVRAIEIGASQVERAEFGLVESLEPAEHDVRVGQPGCKIELVVGGARAGVKRTAAGGIERYPKELHIDGEVPLFIVLKSDRAVLKRPPQHYPARASLPAEEPTLFEAGEVWFEARENLENQARVRRKELDHVDPGLELVRRAMSAVLPGYSDPHIDRSRPAGPTTSQLVLTKGGQELTADMLSEGERSLVVLAMTIAQGLATFEPSAAKVDPVAVVAIDEVELHLHPKWQRTVIPSLLRAFPRCQFIVTTHSPQVIGSVSRESIVVLDDFALYDAAAPTEGRDSNAILEEIMDVPERSEAAGAKLDEIAGLLDRDELEPARTAIDQLAMRWGEDDREVVRLRTALHFRELYDADDSQGQ